MEEQWALDWAIELQALAIKNQAGSKKQALFLVMPTRFSLNAN